MSRKMDTKNEKRRNNGKFAPGNKEGGRKPIPDDIKQAFRELVPEAIQKLTALIHSTENEKVLLEAVKVVLERAYGKPSQEIDLQGKLETDNVVKIMLEGELEKWGK